MEKQSVIDARDPNANIAGYTMVHCRYKCGCHARYLFRNKDESVLSVAENINSIFDAVCDDCVDYVVANYIEE